MNNTKLLALITLFLCGFFSGIGAGYRLGAQERMHIAQPGDEK